MPFTDPVSEAGRQARVARRRLKAYVAGLSLRADLHTAGRTPHGLTAYFSRKVDNQADVVGRKIDAVDQELASIGRGRRRHLRVLRLRGQRARLRRTAGVLEEARKAGS